MLMQFPDNPVRQEGSEDRNQSPLVVRHVAWFVVSIIIAGLVFYGVLFYVVLRLTSRQRNSEAEVTTTSGLKYRDVVKGTGATPQRGQTITVHYTGTLENGTKFGSSYDRPGAKPSDFRIGVGAVIKGWDEGLMSMKVGGKRHLVIPANLGYGPAGKPPGIPGNATLIFDVELLGVK